MMRHRSHAGSTAVVSALVLVLAMLPGPAEAKGKGKGHHGYQHHHYHRDYKPRVRPQHHHHYHHHYHKSKRRSNEGAYLLGGIVIGSVLTHVIQQPRSHYAPAPAVVHHAPSYGRRLFRDAHGNCFERRGDGAGEVLIPLPSWECAW
jgi:hypothetical protein